MPNREHLDILGKGAENWNVWRMNNPRIRPNLAGADLSSADVGGARLERADLSDSVLTRASLHECDLSGADLRRALLFGADLTRANLSHADLSGADLSRALLWETIFGDTDLSDAIGLDQCVHRGPSTLDLRSVLLSGFLPEAFLRGCGLPDSLIDYLPSLLNTPIQFYSCFLSYSSVDQEFASRLHSDLQDRGIRCWFAPQDLRIGARIRSAIDEAIRVHDKLLLILSDASVRSQWVEQEVERAFEKERKTGRSVLFPVRLDDAVMREEAGWASFLKNTRHIGDFRQWKEHDAYQSAFQRLMRDLQTEESSTRRPVA
jgi:hypothetical protein